MGGALQTTFDRITLHNRRSSLLTTRFKNAMVFRPDEAGLMASLRVWAPSLRSVRYNKKASSRLGEACVRWSRLAASDVTLPQPSAAPQ